MNNQKLQDVINKLNSEKDAATHNYLCDVANKNYHCGTHNALKFALGLLEKLQEESENQFIINKPEVWKH